MLCILISASIISFQVHAAGCSDVIDGTIDVTADEVECRPNPPNLPVITAFNQISAGNDTIRIYGRTEQTSNVVVDAGADNDIIQLITGDINGIVTGNDGNDSIEAIGFSFVSLNGVLYGGIGNDTFTLREHTEVNFGGGISGGSGDDLIKLEDNTNVNDRTELSSSPVLAGGIFGGTGYDQIENSADIINTYIVTGADDPDYDLATGPWDHNIDGNLNPEIISNRDSVLDRVINRGNGEIKSAHIFLDAQDILENWGVVHGVSLNPTFIYCDGGTVINYNEMSDLQIEDCGSTVNLGVIYGQNSIDCLGGEKFENRVNGTIDSSNGYSYSSDPTNVTIDCDEFENKGYIKDSTIDLVGNILRNIRGTSPGFFDGVIDNVTIKNVSELVNSGIIGNSSIIDCGGSGTVNVTNDAEATIVDSTIQNCTEVTAEGPVLGTTVSGTAGVDTFNFYDDADIVLDLDDGNDKFSCESKYHNQECNVRDGSPPSVVDLGRGMDTAEFTAGKLTISIIRGGGGWQR